LTSLKHGKVALETFDAAQREAIKACLEKVLREPGFASSKLLSRFLSYIVTETIEGRGNRLKGYNIALSVFDKGEHFNPQTNSVVRVEATRMRRQLAIYYAKAGTLDRFEIRLNRGTYVPVFIERSVKPVPVRRQIAEEEPAALPLPDAPRPRFPAWFMAKLAAGSRLWPMFAAVAIAAAAVLYLAAPSVFPVAAPEATVASAGPDSGSDWALPPSISVARLERADDSPLSTARAEALVREIGSALAGFDSLRVFDENGPKASATDAEYRLIGSAARTADRLTISFRLIHTADNQIVWAKSFDDLPIDLRAENRLPVVASLSSTLGRLHGVIFADRFKHMPEFTDSATGFACIIYSARYFNAPTLAKYSTAQDCVERSLRDEPKSSANHAMQAILLLDGYVKGYAAEAPGDTLAKALTAANQAVELKPHSARAYQALFMARFFDRRFDEAFEAAERAIELNPFSIEIKSRVGGAYILRGQNEKGMALLSDASSMVETKAGWLEFYFFLSAYMHGDDNEARRHGLRISATRTPLGNMARIIVSHRSGKDKATAKWIANLNDQFPEFAGDISGALERLAMIEPIKQKVLADLEAAGVTVKSRRQVSGSAER
jgi:TolB-like protein